MHTNMRNRLRLTTLLLVVMTLLGSGLFQGKALAAAQVFDLYTITGTASLPGASVPVWGYSFTSSATATLPGGPTIIVNQGDTVTITLHNSLSERTALIFQGQDMIPDTTGVAAGDTGTYTFTASRPGTYLYEAGLLPNAQHQVAMGLYGALVVRPVDGTNIPITIQAYASASTAFDDEAVVVLSEIDPALNNSASPAAFDMRNYAPKYFLINGKVYPNTDPIPTLAGNKVLLRYANAGLLPYSMSVLGLRQTAIAMDGSPFSYPRTIVAETIAPGQTADMIVSIPAAAADGSKFALYDGNLMLHNNKANNTLAGGFGGMLTFLTVTGTPPPGDTTGPSTSGVTLTATSVSATVSDLNSGGSNVTAAEFFVDSTGANGSGIAMTGAFGAVTVNVSGTITPALSGSHTVFVHGLDAAGNWGPFQSAVISNDTTGPTTSALGLSPNPSNGSVNVALSATADDRLSGNSNIFAAEYTIDGGTAVLMSVSPAGAKIASLTASIPAATVYALSEGSHVVSVRSQDSLGNWGTPATINLVKDKTGPNTSGVTASPSATNGTQGFNSSTPAVRITATFVDTLSKISAGEGFIDAAGANGTGFIFLPSDGSFNSSTEIGYSDISLTTINALSVGNHTLYVHGKDAAGNWGATSSVVILIDKVAPTFSSITLAPSPTNGAPTVTLTVNGANDPLVLGLASGVTGGEYWFGATNPAPGGGTQFSGTTASIPVSSLATGTYTVSVRIRDAAGNWSTISSATLTVWANAIFSDGFETGNFSAWSSTSTNSATRLSVTAAAALVGTRGMQAQGNNTNYVQYNFGTAVIPVAPTYDARFYFRPNGNSSTGKDILSAATSSAFSTTLFRVRYRLNGTTPQMQIQVGTTNTNATWTNINGGTSNNVIEVVWQAVGSGGPNPGTLQLIVNGVVAQTLTTTSTGSVAAVRMGSVTSTGNSTLMYFDAFGSKRTVSPLIGP